MQSPIPNPELISEIGVVGYLLVVLIVTGMGVNIWFLRRMVQAMDRMAEAEEECVPVMSAITVKLDALDSKVDHAIALAEEHVAIARLWKATEAPGRRTRKFPPAP